MRAEIWDGQSDVWASPNGEAHPSQFQMALGPYFVNVGLAAIHRRVMALMRTGHQVPNSIPPDFAHVQPTESRRRSSSLGFWNSVHT